MANKYSRIRSANPDSLGTTVTAYTPADVDLPSNVRAVFFDTDGTFTIRNADATLVTGIPCLRGNPVPFVPNRITAMTGPANCFIVS